MLLGKSNLLHTFSLFLRSCNTLNLFCFFTDDEVFRGTEHKWGRLEGLHSATLCRRLKKGTALLDVFRLELSASLVHVRTCTHNTCNLFWIFKKLFLICWTLVRRRRWWRRSSSMELTSTSVTSWASRRCFGRQVFQQFLKSCACALT